MKAPVKIGMKTAPIQASVDPELTQSPPTVNPKLAQSGPKVGRILADQSSARAKNNKFGPKWVESRRFGLKLGPNGISFPSWASVLQPLNLRQRVPLEQPPLATTFSEGIAYTRPVQTL